MGRTLNENTAYFPEGAIRSTRSKWLNVPRFLPTVGFEVKGDGMEGSPCGQL